MRQFFVIAQYIYLEHQALIMLIVAFINAHTKEHENMYEEKSTRSVKIELDSVVVTSVSAQRRVEMTFARTQDR